MSFDDELEKARLANATIIDKREPLQLAVGHEPGRVVVVFNQAINLLAFTPTVAREFAANLIKRAHLAENIKETESEKPD